jgi:TetR/AcrR family transcriptional repressor of uid operon
MAKQARAIATREAIVQGAGIVFGEVSYATATLQDVIAHAGVTQGALYFHFDSKLDLAHEVIRQQHELSMRAAERFADDDLPSLDALILLSGELARQIRSEPVVQGGLRLTTESGQLFPDHSRGPYLDWIESTEHFLRGAAAHGQLKGDLDLHAMARYVISAFTGVQVVSRSLTGWADFVDRLEEMWRLQLPLLLDAPSEDEIGRLAALVRSAEA